MGLIAAMGYYVNMNYLRDAPGTLDNLGLMCVALNILNFAAPLAGLVRLFFVILFIYFCFLIAMWRIEICDRVEERKTINLHKLGSNKSVKLILPNIIDPVYNLVI